MLTKVDLAKRQASKPPCAKRRLLFVTRRAGKNPSSYVRGLATYGFKFRRFMDQSVRVFTNEKSGRYDYWFSGACTGALAYGLLTLIF